MIEGNRRGAPVHGDHRLLGEEAVGGEGGGKIHQEVGDGAVSGVFDLSHVLELVVDGLDDGPLPDQNLVRDAHERALHVAPELREELYPVHEQFLEQTPAYVTLVPDEFPRDVLQKGGALQRLPVIHVARGQYEAEQLPLLVADQVQLEAVEPPH